jgi:hypothetical protein
MDDRFLHDLRRAPPREFAGRLRLALSSVEADEPAARIAPRVAKWSALAASLALAASIIAFPPLRAGAQAFLDLFRVVNFAGVAIDPGRFAVLEDTDLDLPRMLGEQVEVLEEAGEPVAFATLEAAGDAAGLDLLVPAYVPVGWERTGVSVAGAQGARITVSTAKLQTLLDALAISDVSVPTELDGQQVTLRVPPVVHMTYANETRSVSFAQAASPDVAFPAGFDLAGFAEIGLRIMGLDRDEAYRVAQSIDWRSTLIVPVPATAATFREVNVQGQPGLMIESSGGTGSGGGGNLLLWSSADRVFALGGALGTAALLEMAQTVQ